MDGLFRSGTNQGVMAIERCNSNAIVKRACRKGEGRGESEASESRRLGNSRISISSHPTSLQTRKASRFPDNLESVLGRIDEQPHA